MGRQPAYFALALIAQDLDDRHGRRLLRCPRRLCALYACCYFGDTASPTFSAVAPSRPLSTASQGVIAIDATTSCYRSCPCLHDPMPCAVYPCRLGTKADQNVDGTSLQQRTAS